MNNNWNTQSEKSQTSSMLLINCGRILVVHFLHIQKMTILFIWDMEFYMETKDNLWLLLI